MKKHQLRKLLKFGFKGTNNDGTYLYRVWDVTKLEEEGIDTSDISDEEKFIIEYNLVESTADVASTKGYTDSDGTAIYKLSDF